MKLVNRVGQQFGKLIVVEQAGRNNLKKVLWKCKCECGKETVVTAGALVTKNTLSCGCVKPNFKHGGWNRASYNSWRAMIRRCTKPQDKDYKRYGGIGITVCDRWLSYVNFVADMGEPVGNETLDRINTYGNYEPTNCRWASVAIQNRNIRVRPTSKSGHIGIQERGGKWMAQITAKKRKYYSKCFNTIEEAIVARKELEKKYWTE